MDIRQQIIKEIEKVQASDLSKAEKTTQIIDLARKLGKFLLERDNH